MVISVFHRSYFPFYSWYVIIIREQLILQRLVIFPFLFLVCYNRRILFIRENQHSYRTRFWKIFIQTPFMFPYRIHPIAHTNIYRILQHTISIIQQKFTETVCASSILLRLCWNIKKYNQSHKFTHNYVFPALSILGFQVHPYYPSK